MSTNRKLSQKFRTIHKTEYCAVMKKTVLLTRAELSKCCYGKRLFLCLLKKSLILRLAGCIIPHLFIEPFRLHLHTAPFLTQVPISTPQDPTRAALPPGSAHILSCAPPQNDSSKTQLRACCSPQAQFSQPAGPPWPGPAPASATSYYHSSGTNEQCRTVQECAADTPICTC